MGNQKLNTALKLRVLPPTTIAYEQHERRAHLQAAIWRSALEADPPVPNPAHYG